MPRKILFLVAALFLSYLVASRLASVPISKIATALAQGRRTSSFSDSNGGADSNGRGQPAADTAILGGDIAPVRAVADPYPVFEIGRAHV